MPQWSINQPPIGIAYLSAYLKKHSYQVEQRDLSIEMYSRLPKEKKYICDSHHHENYLDEARFRDSFAPDVEPFIDEWANELAAKDALYLGFTVLSSNKIPTLMLIERIKKIAPSKIIILGGPHCTRYEGGFELAKNSNVDFVVPDEGEEVLFELLEVLRTQEHKVENIAKIKGILFIPTEARNLPESSQWISVNKGIRALKDDRIVDTGERELIQNINDLPVPSFEGFKLNLYDYLNLPILGSRGCIYKCTFCSETVLWKRFRYRTGENLFREFKMQFFLNNTRNFYIVDSLINGNIKELENMCDLLIKNQLRVYWGGKASIRKEMTKELLQKLFRAGCMNLDYGIESGSPKVIKDMKKGFHISTATQVLKDTAEAGIRAGIFMMVGFPTETEEDYNLSKQFIIENKRHIHHVTTGYGFGVQPGSETYINPEKFGIQIKDGYWESEHVNPEILNFRVRDFREFCIQQGMLVT